MFIYFWDRERRSMNRRGPEREGDTESEAGSWLWAVSTESDAGLELTDGEIMTWGEVGRTTNWATQAPHDNEVFFYWICHQVVLSLLNMYSNNKTTITNTIDAKQKVWSHPRGQRASTRCQKPNLNASYPVLIKHLFKGIVTDHLALETLYPNFKMEISWGITDACTHH